jgi:hypothetical protein
MLRESSKHARRNQIITDASNCMINLSNWSIYYHVISREQHVYFKPLYKETKKNVENQSSHTGHTVESGC